MFAFAIYDGRNGREKVVVARDRLGIKPLYYTQVNGSLLFASEIKSLLEFPSVPREPDFTAMDNYLTLQYVPAPLTMFKGIFKLPPAHTMAAAPDGAFAIKQYWDVDFCEADSAVDEDDAAAELLSLCEEAVRLRLIADVPLGALLSGGLDSATIVALMARQRGNPVKTFTVGFEVGKGKAGSNGRYNELVEARGIAALLGTEHHEIVISAPMVQELLPKLVWHLDEPLADRAALPTYLICKYARQSVKVVLTGEGGDELFGGYPRYGWFKASKRLQRALPSFVRDPVLTRGLSQFMRSDQRRKHVRLLLGDFTDAERHLRWIGSISEEDKAGLYTDTMRHRIDNNHHGAEASTHGIINKYLLSKAPDEVIHALMYLDIKTWLVDDILAKVDKMSMACGLEARVPFLDHKLVEFVATMPVWLKSRNMGTKWLVRRMMKDILPADVLRQKKHPFSVPAKEWFRGDLQSFARELLTSETTATREHFHGSAVAEMLRRHSTGQRDFNQLIWNLLCLELWHRIYIDRTISC
jgi:asparagine synthase (glutamine-hydrolysing)